MSVAHVQSATGGTSGSGTSIAATGSAVTSGNFVAGWVTLGSDTLTELTSVTDDKGNTYTIVDSVGSGGHNQMWAGFYKPNITNGPSTITANFASSHSANSIDWDEFSGIATASPLDGHAMQNQVSPATSADAITSGNITTTTDGDLIYAGSTEASPGSGTLTSGTGFTSLATDTLSSDVCVMQYKVQTTHGSIAGTFTDTPSPGSIITGVMAFKAASGGSPNVTLTAVSSSGAAAAMTPSVQPATLSAVTSSGAAAAMTPNVQPILSAVAATAAAAAFTMMISDNLSLGAIAATGAVVALIAQVSIALGAVSSAGAAAMIVPAVSVGLSAIAGVGAVVAFTPSITGGTVNITLAAVSAIGAAASFLFNGVASYLTHRMGYPISTTSHRMRGPS